MGYSQNLYHVLAVIIHFPSQILIFKYLESTFPLSLILVIMCCVISACLDLFQLSMFCSPLLFCTSLLLCTISLCVSLSLCLCLPPLCPSLLTLPFERASHYVARLTSHSLSSCLSLMSSGIICMSPASLFLNSYSGYLSMDLGTGKESVHCVLTLKTQLVQNYS